MSEGKRERDSATIAFRRWARAGCPEGEEIRRDGSDMERDFRACAAVFVMLEREAVRGRENTAAAEIRRAVEEVYMAEPRRPMRKNEVVMRVRRLAAERYVSERAVYKWLRRARMLWWRVRER